jgi:hypothetical protein
VSNLGRLSTTARHTSYVTQLHAGGLDEQVLGLDAGPRAGRALLVAP